MLIWRTFSLFKNNHVLLRAFYHFQSNSPSIPSFVQNGRSTVRPNPGKHEGEDKVSFGAPSSSFWARLLCSLKVSRTLRLCVTSGKIYYSDNTWGQPFIFIYFYRFVLIIFHHTSHGKKKKKSWSPVKRILHMRNSEAIRGIDRSDWQISFIYAIDNFLEFCVRKDSAPASGFTR